MYKRLGSAEFQNTIRSGVGYHSKFFSFKIAPNLLQQTRIGVAVSKKLAKKANQRNYYKRVLRNLLREVPTLPAGYDIILIAHPDIKNQRFAILKKDAQELLHKALDK